MKLLWATVLFLVLFASLTIAQSQVDTNSEKIQQLNNWRIQQEQHNVDQAVTDSRERAEGQANLQKELEKINSEIDLQGNTIKSLDSSVSQVKFLGFLFCLLLGVAVPVTIAIVKEKKTTNEKKDSDIKTWHDNILERLDELDKFKISTELQMPLLIDLSQSVVTSLVNSLHHPHDHHRIADNLLDKVGGDMTDDEISELYLIMLERSIDHNVSQSEQKAAAELPNAMNIVQKLKAIQQKKNDIPKIDFSVDDISNDL